MDAAALASPVIEHGALLLTIAHFGSALAVTLHALFGKREVAAAVGWIGLAWLSPFFGPFLYLCLGINRVKRRAQRLRGVEGSSLQAASLRNPRGETDHSLQNAVGKITGIGSAPGGVSDILHCGDEAYPIMLRAIESAQRSIILATFIFRADAIGARFIAALIDAQRRGVAVRVLIDGFGGGFLRSAAYYQLRQAQVPVARYLHSLLPWKMPLLDLRLHKKIMVVDGRSAFIGGLNIGNENLLATKPPEPVRDVHFRIEGPVVDQIAASFQDDWSFTTGESLDGPEWLGEEHAAGGAPARVVASGPDQSVDQLALVLLAAISSAKSSIRIATPYFLPDEQLVTALQLAALRGVTVDIVLPSRNNHRLVGWAVYAHVRPLLKMGCRIWRSPPPFDHSKLMVVDDEWCLVGSANWDARSLRLNFELTVEFHDSDLARRLSAIIERKLTDPITVAEIDGRWGIVKIRDAAARLLMPYL